MSGREDTTRRNAVDEEGRGKGRISSAYPGTEGPGVVSISKMWIDDRGLGDFCSRSDRTV